MKFAAGFLLLALSMRAQVRIVPHGTDRTSVEISGQPFTELFAGPETNKPYLHPLRSATGKVVTRYYPMENIVGEAHDHPHHRGVWFSHGDVNGFDFWGNEQRGGKFGRIVLLKIDRITSGDKEGSIDATFEWRDPSGKALLSERRRMTFYSQPDVRTVDLDITLTAKNKVTFGDTKEGTFAMRLGPELSEPKVHMVDSEGHEGEKQIWGKAANWVDYYGVVGGEPLGVAIFDHPSNPRHPTRWHARGYGLFAANIFGLHDFDNNPKENGSLTLDEGNNLRFRYRVLIHSGNVHSGRIAERYVEYAGPVTQR